MIKANRTPYLFKRLCSRLIQNLHPGIHDLHKTFNASHSPLELLCKLNNPADSSQQCGHIQRISHQISWLNMSLYHKNPAGYYHHHIHQTVKHSYRILKGCHIQIAFPFDFQKCLIILAKFLNFDILVSKCPHYPVSQQIILNPGIQFSDLLPLLSERMLYLQIEIGARQYHNRNKNKDDNSKRQVDS